MKSLRSAAGSLCAGLLLLARGPAIPAAPSDSLAVTAEVHVPLFLKALAYDRNLEEKARGDILVGLLSRPGDVESEAVARSVAKLIAGYPNQKISDLPVYYRMIPYQDSQDLGKIVQAEWVDVIYVSPGVGAFLDDVLRVTAEGKVLSISGVAEYVERGVTMGVEDHGGRPEMVVNLASAEHEGSKFSGQFLSLCHVIRKDAPGAQPGRPPKPGE